jgi:hypothetical protein
MRVGDLVLLFLINSTKTQIERATAFAAQILTLKMNEAFPSGSGV